jgi:hypothetical protein
MGDNLGPNGLSLTNCAQTRFWRRSIKRGQMQGQASWTAPWKTFLRRKRASPRDIPEDVLSRVGMFIVHRLINERDQAVVINASGILHGSPRHSCQT